MVGTRRAKKKVETYQICVTIIEAKHIEPNTNVMVAVRVGNRKKKTAIRKTADNTYFREYFVFDLTCDLDTLLSTRIAITAYLYGGLIKRCKFHGSFDFEVASVWDQSDHLYHHKWAMLTNPRDPASGPRGYVKCNLAVHAKGEKLKTLPETDEEDDIEGNLLLPFGDARHFAARLRVRYVFTVHRAEALPERILATAKQACQVQVAFAGMKASTSDGYGNNLRFDERIVFKEMFPPLSHRVKIAVKKKSHVIASYFLNLKDISNSGEYGFLPTFGPSFLHLYIDGHEVPTEPIYRGRLLLSLRTEIERTEAAGPSAAGVYIEPTASIIEDSLWHSDEYLLVGVLYDACMIGRDQRGATLSFEISLGNAGNRRFAAHQRACEDEEDDENVVDDSTPSAGPATGCASADSQSGTLEQVTSSADNKYSYIPIDAKKPCMFVKSQWPNTEWRMENSNRLNYIADYLEAELEKLEALKALDHGSAYSSYNVTSRTLRRQCDSYLESLRETASDSDSSSTWSMTSLDRHRLNHCALEVESVLQRLKANGELVDNRYLGIAMLHAYDHLRAIRDLCKDPQHGLPDVFVWMLSRRGQLGYARLPAARLLYAEERSGRGRDCGRKLDLFLHKPGKPDELVCKLELFLWLGGVRYAGACWAALPQGYELDELQLDGDRLDVFPRYLEYVAGTKFQLRAHIFQGRFEPGMDSSGLLDPMVRVIFRGYSMTTTVINQTLDPLWDQTLIFPPVEIHGKREYVKNHPPRVVLEVLDRDFYSLELYGRFIAKPLVKLDEEMSELSDTPAKLRWHRFEASKTTSAKSSDFGAAVLAAFELVEINDKEIQEDSVKMYKVPEDVRPRMASYRLEVIFWGVRDMKRLNFVPVHRPKVTVNCAGTHVESQVMENAKKFANFRENRVTVDMEMPEEETYYPPLTIKAYDSRGFGYFKYAGVCSLATIYALMQPLVTRSEYEAAIYHSSSSSFLKKSRLTAATAAAHLTIDAKPETAEAAALTSYKTLAKQRRDSSSRGHFLKRLLAWRRAASSVRITPAADRDESQDWWSKYYASLEVYAAELEAQPEFSAFQDRLRTFELKRGKRTVEDDADNFAGKFKGYIAVYRWPHPEGLACVNRLGQSASFGLCSDYPSQEPLQLLVRLYVVKAINLRPSDPLSGKADPYLRVELGKNRVNDRKNYIPNQLNPTFGRVIELDAAFPRNHTLTIQVWDYDAASSDDLIGKTEIDLENRFYSRHRAHCGLALRYDEEGYNAWRDREKPTQILYQLCRRNNLPAPEFWPDHVIIAKRRFHCSTLPEDDVDREEHMALSVLHRWADFPVCGCSLVPEHVERRPLFNPKRPGLEQGKLEMWIDMFPVDELPAKPAVDISPQPPEECELRVIIWNTEDVPLVDNQFLTGEKCSDIYVKGWILPEDTQRTDVHYNSLTGEGNFNWRLIFQFTWARAERAMVIKRRSHVFAKDPTEHKVPCRLNLQVWDSDHFSKDDFLGDLSLELANMPRGSPSAQSCGLKLLDPQSPRMNLFRAQRARAWWPLSTSTPSGKYYPAGKIELELAVLPLEEAETRPAGKGREPPEELPLPDRPDTSFSWFRNPWKAFRFVFFRYYRWRVLGCCAFVLLVLLIACAVYAFPGYLVKRLLKA
ncbi:otoferlin [Copidosoma floridanum]|uniref:otoferlin n=1 Tax=Copidosoma floridanum TaxID=29053 RepID=UPI0006C94670|nr:otoferlin [Copidosoma floridanum]